MESEINTYNRGGVYVKVDNPCELCFDEETLGTNLRPNKSRRSGNVLIRLVECDDESRIGFRYFVCLDCYENLADGGSIR